MRSTPACDLAAVGDVEALRALPADALRALDSKGSAPVHWAASCGRLEVLAFLVEEAGVNAEDPGLISARSKRRRPLHWAARNGQLETVKYLVEVAGVDPDPRDKQSVSPFQLAVWQCWLEVARYLVECADVDVAQLNIFNCGAQHWLGTVPRERAADIMPMARWLQSCGLDFAAVQRQGHRPLHKAAWGGHLVLCQWLRDECGACDDAQDEGGNFAADVAEMAGHADVASWLRAECSGARAHSCAVMGLPLSTTCHATIRRRFLELVRELHPDRQRCPRGGHSGEGGGGEGRAGEGGGDGEGSASEGGGVEAGGREGGEGSATSFEAIRAAYEHLTRDGGRGAQANPTHSLRLMLQATDSLGGDADRGGNAGGVDDVRCFRAKLAAVCHEYAPVGIPLASLRKKYAEVWHEPIPSPAALGLPPRTSLLRLMEHFNDTVSLRHENGGASTRVIALVSRKTALYGEPSAADGAGGASSTAEQQRSAVKLELQRAAQAEGWRTEEYMEEHVEEFAGVGAYTAGAELAMPPDLPEAGVIDVEAGSTEPQPNTRKPAVRWPESELAKLPGDLRPQAGQTLDLILQKKVLLLQSRRGCTSQSAHHSQRPFQAPALVSSFSLTGLARARVVTPTDRANTDSMLLPYFGFESLCVAGVSPPQRVADLGCGNGLVGILAALQWPSLVEVSLFERQPALAELAFRNLALNGIAATLLAPEPRSDVPHAMKVTGPLCMQEDALRQQLQATVHVCDLSQHVTTNGTFDVVLCNPPFYTSRPNCGGVQRKRSFEKEGAWVESTLDIGGFLAVMADLLRVGGWGVIIFDVAEECRLLAALHSHAGRLRVSRMARTVHCEGGDLGTQGSSRLLVLVRRHQEGPSEELAHDWVGNNRTDAPIDSGDTALTPQRQHATKPAVTEPSPDDGRPGWMRAGDVIGLHADENCNAYTESIERWMRSLPPSYYSIRTPVCFQGA